MSTWPQWVGVLGIAVEFAGFAVLAYELIQTNRAQLAETTLLASEKTLFETLQIDEGSYSDPKSGSASVKGGVLGRLVESIPRRQAEVARSRSTILWGVAISGLGVVAQIASAVAQALNAAP